MYCEMYKATIPEETCWLRCQELAGWNPGKDMTLGAPPYHRFGGCLKCERGQDLIERIKEGEEMTKLEDTKQCSKCKEEKPHSEFYRDSKSPDKLGYWCKGCSRESSQAVKKKVPASPPGIESREEKVKAAMGVLFANHGDLFESIKKMAEDQYRSPDMQMLFLLNGAVAGSKASQQA